MIPASLAFRLVLLIDELRLKLPTAPVNEAGLPAGRALTVMRVPGAVRLFCTLLYESKKSSKILRTCALF